MHQALDDKAVHKIVCIKSAQVAWTDGVLLNYIGKRIDTDPCPMIVMFAKEDAAKSFNSEKFTPMVEATPRLREIMPAFQKSRDKENRWAYKGFPGGFLKFVGSNSPSSVKSTPAPVVAVEEPDDCSSNLDGQGDTITMLEERAKTYKNSKVIFGGTPTVKGFSRVEQAYLQSDQRKFYVPCHHCEEAHVLAFDHVKWDKSGSMHDVYGDALPSSAYYACPNCGGVWTDADKIKNVRRAVSAGFGWKAHAPFYGIAGFYVNEIYSPFPGSRFARLAEKYLAAKYALNQGDDNKMRSFQNNTEGKSYSYKTDAPSAEEFESLALEYDELKVPAGGAILTAGVDVQHDRFAIVIRAWGEAEKSWLVYWGEIYGATAVYGSGAWPDLEAFLKQAIPHESGGFVSIKGGTIDCSDGTTSDAVYSFVRKNKDKWLAGKGSSNDYGNKEIYSLPRAVEVKGNQKPKADKYGIKVYSIGTMRAKDLILGSGQAMGRCRMKSGPAMHCYKTVRQDYFSQVVESEVKIPHKTQRGKMSYQLKSGVRNEALDCEVYALHRARSLRVHLLTVVQWAREFERITGQKQIEPTANAVVETKPTEKKKSFWDKT